MWVKLSNNMVLQSLELRNWLDEDKGFLGLFFLI